MSTEILTPSLYGAGVHDGQPVALTAGQHTATLSGVALTQADLQDPTKSCGLAILASYDGGKSFAFAGGSVGGTDWQGGTLGRDGITYAAPVVAVTFDANRPPSHVLGRLILTGPLAIGLGLDLT